MRRLELTEKEAEFLLTQIATQWAEYAVPCAARNALGVAAPGISAKAWRNRLRVYDARRLLLASMYRKLAECDVPDVDTSQYVGIYRAPHFGKNGAVEYRDVSNCYLRNRAIEYRRQLIAEAIAQAS